LFVAALLIPNGAGAEEYLGRLSANKYARDSTANPYGTYGSAQSTKSVRSATGKYGSHTSVYSAANPYATHAPKLYDSEGNYRGRLSDNTYDPDSVSNPYGRYGSTYSYESINNPYGAGSKYRPDSPNNPTGTGWKIVSDD